MLSASVLSAASRAAASPATASQSWYVIKMSCSGLPV